MTGTRYHFCHTIISGVALVKLPSQNHPSNPPRCRVSILKITISRRSPSFTSLHLFPISLLVWFPFLRLPLRRLMRFGFSSLLFLYSVMVLTSDEIREILLRLSTSQALVPLSFLSMKHERRENGGTNDKMRDKERKRERNVKFWLILLKFQENKRGSRRCTQLASCVLERLHFAGTSYVELKHL